MPITGRTPTECFKQFREHLAALLAKTVGATSYVGVKELNEGAQIGFRFQGDKAVAVPIETNHGKLFFGMSQLIRADKLEGKHKLTTVKYWYRLQRSDGKSEDALIRWEYDRREGAEKGKRHARHHVQLDAKTSTPGLDLNRLHVPSGWVAIEEILRFLIHDLEMEPPCGDEWDKVLTDSEKIFREEFSTQND